MTLGPRPSWQERLKAVAALTDGWFEPGSIAVRRDVVDAARAVLADVDDIYDSRGIMFAPLQDGGIAFECHDGQSIREVDIEQVSADAPLTVYMWEAERTLAEVTGWRDWEGPFDQSAVVAFMRSGELPN